MQKRTLAIILFIFILAGGVYIWLRVAKEETPANSAIKAIPINASFILESRKTFSLWKNISKKNNIWKDIIDVPYFGNLNSYLNSLDSIVGGNSDLDNILESQPLFMSAHLTGLNKFNYLFVCSIPTAASQSSISAFLESLKSKSPENDFQYEETTIHCIKTAENNLFYYTIKDGIFISSFAPSLVKESLRQLESGISLMNNVYFTKVLNVSGSQAMANLFINFQTFTNVSSLVVNKNFLSTAASIQDFGQWMELDISFNPDEVIMSGFTDCDSTGSQFLNTFQGQALHEIKVASVAPANTIFMECHEFSNYAAYQKKYDQYLGRRDKYREKAEWISKTEQLYGLNPEKYFYSWISNEVAQVITEPSDSTFQNDTYVLVEANDVGGAMKKLSAFSDTVALKKKTKPIDSVYMRHEICNMGVENITGNLLGKTFGGVTKSWFTSVGNYIVFANSLSSLKTFIFDYEGGVTLQKDSYYKDYVKEHVESESGIYVYNNMALSSMFYAKYLDKAYATEFGKNKEAFSKFHAASIQFSYLQGMFYTNFYFKRNPLFRKEAAPLWQAALDSSLVIDPCWVTDYVTHRQFVFCEDKNENVYLINNLGHIEWRKKVHEDIQRPVYQVDALKNNKIQYLFNTEHNIDLLDKNGEELNGFPVKLKYSSTAPLEVLNYDNKKNYRLLIPCSDLKIREYDMQGKPVDGWAMPQTKQVVKCPGHYCQVKGKDYLLYVDNGGRVYAFDRKGNETLNLDNRLPLNIKNFYVLQGQSLADSYIWAIDSLGTVFKLSLSGELSTVKYLKGACSNPDFIPLPADSGTKQKMLFLCGSDVWVYDTDKKECFHTDLKDETGNTISVFKRLNHAVEIGAVDKRSEKIYLWDITGKLCPGFPLYGSMGFSVADMNDNGSMYLLTGADNKVYVYALP